jgi:hypothetical protein
VQRVVRSTSAEQSQRSSQSAQAWCPVTKRAILSRGGNKGPGLPDQVQSGAFKCCPISGTTAVPGVAAAGAAGCTAAFDRSGPLQQKHLRCGRPRRASMSWLASHIFVTTACAPGHRARLGSRGGFLLIMLQSVSHVHLRARAWRRRSASRCADIAMHDFVASGWAMC